MKFIDSTEVKWAFLFMGISIIWMVGEKALGLHDHNIDKHYHYTQFFVVPVFLVYVFALVDKRKGDFDMMMTYKQGLITGVQITAYITILCPLIQFINLELISPDYFANAIQYNVSTGRFAQGEAEMYFSLRNFVIQSMIGVTVIGNTVAIIVAYLIKTI